MTLRIGNKRHTKKVRGILCHPCNSVLGYAKDRKDVLLAAIEYLEAAR